MYVSTTKHFVNSCTLCESFNPDWSKILVYLVTFFLVILSYSTNLKHVRGVVRLVRNNYCFLLHCVADRVKVSVGVSLQNKKHFKQTLFIFASSFVSSLLSNETSCFNFKYCLRKLMDVKLNLIARTTFKELLSTLTSVLVLFLLSFYKLNY